MKYNSDIHHRRSIRLKNYDYCLPNGYFVTICTYEKFPYFGKIENGKMILNEIGLAAQKYWQEIPEHFPGVILDAFVIMPNHVHGILVICDRNIVGRGVDLSRPNINGLCLNQGAINCAPTIENNDSIKKRGGFAGENNPLLSNNSLAKIIRWFKGRTTFELRRQNNFGGFCWQRNYYEHVIRSEKSLEKLRDYIQFNPVRWEKDDLFLGK